MSNSASFVTFVHKRVARTHAERFADIYGSNATSAITVTLHSGTQSIIVSKVTNPAITVHTASYSYDGIVHTDSYWSDV